MQPPMDTTKYAVIYPRQSSAAQVEHNVYSLERQLALKGKAEADGFDADLILVVDDDLGVSGARIESRPGFSRALKLINQGVVAAVYVEDLTRLSRDERTIDQMVIADACERSGARIFMGGSWYDMRDAAQRMSYKYQAIGGSEYWRSHLAKLRGARDRKAAQGKAATALPRGYRPNREGRRSDPHYDKPIIHEPEAEVIRLLVARLPEAGGLKALFRAVDPLFWPDGSRLSQTHLAKLLRSPILRGHYVHGAIVVMDNHPPIIGPEDAAMIDDLLATNRATRRRPGAEAMGVLAGLVWCPACSRTIRTNATRHSPSYRCSHEGPPRTYHFGLALEEVDAVVLGDLWPRLTGDLVDRILGGLEEKRRRVASVSDQRESQRKAIQRRIGGYMKSLADPDLPEIARKMIQTQVAEAGAQLEEVDASSPRIIHLNADVRWYRELRGDPLTLVGLQAGWDTEPLAWRRQWLRKFIARVELHDDGGVVVRYVGGDVARLAVPFRRQFEDAELAAARELLASPDCPKRGYAEWLQKELATRGFTRSRGGVYRLAAILRARG